MLAQATNAAPVVERVSSDPVLERAVLALVVAVFGLVLREVWQEYRARRERRARDRAILSALLRELAVIAGMVGSIAKDINKERAMLTANERWRLKPLVRFPTTIYDLVKVHIPAALLEHEETVRTLMVLQTQCDYTNALADEHQKWKTPEARGQSDQVETIVSFHESIMESVNAVADGCSTLQPLVVAAGEKVGGLNLAGPPPQPSRSKPIVRRRS